MDHTKMNAHDCPSATNLFRIHRIFALSSSDSQISSIAVCNHERKQLLALSITSKDGDSPHDNYLLVRSVEEDACVRFWRFPLAASYLKQQQERTEKIVALVFSPEGDWLACLSSRKNRLHLLPLISLIAQHRRSHLAHMNQHSYNHEWMSVNPSVMTAQMASYLRATNEVGGLNGARYHSRVAGDDSQMSTLEFAAGLGTVTCIRWWRSMNGHNYCLVGGSENIISIVNVEENAEQCRCELLNAGKIESIDLFYERFRKEKRTSMLVQTRAMNDCIRYFRVVLEKKTLIHPSTQYSTTVSVEEGTEASRLILNSKALNIPTKQYTIKTFPEHFVEDMDFRPQRIKKNSPNIRLCAINCLLSSESSLALYDPVEHKVSVFTNFQWNLKGQYHVPEVLRPTMEGKQNHSADTVTNVNLTYCSSDLMLMQIMKQHHDGKNRLVSAWVSLPSRAQGHDEETDQAQIVHYLTLHDNEPVESVRQTTVRVSTATGGNSEVIYILQTAHNVYECRPQWSRLALFQALCSQAMPLQDALSIGYALGIDMASLCEVVADTICTENCTKLNSHEDAPRTTSGTLSYLSAFVRNTVHWVQSLYQVSRVDPTKAITKLTSIGGRTAAVLFGQQLLAKLPIESEDKTLFTSGKRQHVALQVVDLILQHQARHSFGDESTLLRPRENVIQAELVTEDEWLENFLRTGKEYEAKAMIELCLSHHQIQKAVTIAVHHNDVTLVLERIIDRGLLPLLSAVDDKIIDTLLSADAESVLVQPQFQLVLRALSIEKQVEVMLSHPRYILAQQDWLVRNVRAIPVNLCGRLAEKVDPRNRHEGESVERVELFLTLLLRIVSDQDGDGTPASDAARSLDSTQEGIEQLLLDLFNSYRPPIMITRCVDFENWSAAACLHEAHGELIDAVECRLHGYQERVLASQSSRDHRQESLLDSVGTIIEVEDENESENESDESVVWLRDELLNLLTGLVVKQTSSMRIKHSPLVIDDHIRAAILARVLVKWFEYGLSRTDLELYLVDTTNFKHVATPLVQIFFGDILQQVGTTYDGLIRTFDERDREWVRKCLNLPFSGQFLFHVCTWFLQDKIVTRDTSVQTPETLFDIVKTNIEKNDLSLPFVQIDHHSAQVLGKSDPLETHVKVFTCRHVFPKRVFEEEILSEFDKRINSLPLALFTTKQMLLREYKRSHVEAPCPICAFNKISRLVFQQAQSTCPNQTDSKYYFLHGNPLHRQYPSQSQSNMHEQWVWNAK